MSCFRNRQNSNNTGTDECNAYAISVGLSCLLCRVFCRTSKAHSSSVLRLLCLLASLGTTNIKFIFNEISNLNCSCDLLISIFLQKKPTKWQIPSLLGANQ